jgi:hypothetical protein
VSGFAVDFDTPDPDDDRPYRAALVRDLGVDAVPVDPREANSLARSTLVVDAQPLHVTTGALFVAVGRRARERGAELLMTGMGGDVVLDGEPVLFGALARRGHVFTAVRRAAVLRGPQASGPWQRLHRFIVRPSLGRVLPHIVRRELKRRTLESEFPWKGPALRRWFHERQAAADVPSTRLDSSPLERYRAMASMPFMADLAVIRSLEEAASGCAQCDPLFDDDLLATIAGFPPLALFFGGWSRGLFRHAMEGRMPDKVRFRPGKAYLDPAVVRMVDSAGGMTAFSDLADVRMLADLGLAEPRAFRANFDRLMANPNAFLWWSVWPALAGEALLRHYDAGLPV